MFELTANVYDLWEAEDSRLCPLSPKQLALLERLEKLTTQESSSPYDIESGGDRKQSNLSEGIIKDDSDSTMIGDAVNNFSTLRDIERWFDSVETTLESEDEIRFKCLQDNLNLCQTLSKQIECLLDNLYYLKKMFDSKASKITSVHSMCENILQQERSLIMAVEAINEKLNYFKELEVMTKKLGSSSVLILNESLMPTLTRLDECINFLACKSNYKESEHFIDQYKILQDTALETIKKYVINSIQNAAKSVMPESGKVLSDNDSVFSLFYGRFQSSCARIKSLVTMIEERAENNPLYQQYLDECHQVYFQVRESLIVPVLTAAIDDTVTSYGRSYCTLSRNTCRMLVHICKDEHQLFYQFFTSPSQFLIDFLETLCVQLYNVLRPIVIHINHLETLSELCCILRSEGTEEFSLIQGNETLSFGRALNSLLQDVQERLVYRTAIYIQTNLIEYVPAPGDLAYPDKLEMMESIAECLSTNSPGPLVRSDSLSSITSTTLSDISLATYNDSSFGRYASRSPADIHGMWYPTVRRTIMCLAKLYRSLDKPAFQGLAQEVVAGCLESLKRAGSEISKNKSPSDGSLFLIKHLLIVREQITPFRIECIVREVEIDFERVKTAAMNLFNNRNFFSLKSSNGLLQFLFEVPGAPQVIDHVLDPQKIVDTEIKSICEKFISSSANNMLLPIKSHLELLRRCIKTPSTNLPTIEEINKVLKELTSHLESTNSSIRKSMSLYLANPDTENILFKPIKNKVLKQLDEFRKTVLSAYDKDKHLLIELPPMDVYEKIFVPSNLHDSVTSSTS
ncbi:conserved oligomeric Golgi complex subunit 3 [Tetranychus urticae]|uniref:Conserved oligomeric Golgi complex subunit 3 n=1 Tax=Tetranychus urticae TaxID=32264 RepID=T1KVR5_TETUR|nr:conserved oligomeric Golgi complex subunit 3 [Tetranychus urticae]